MTTLFGSSRDRDDRPATDGKGTGGKVPSLLERLAGAVESAAETVGRAPLGEVVSGVTDVAGGVVGAVRETVDPRNIVAKVDPIGFAPAVASAARGLVTRPLTVTKAGLGLCADSGRATGVALRRSVGLSASGPMDPPAGDRRFNDPAWEGNPYYYLARQEHLIFARRLTELAQAVDLDPTARRKIDFLVDQIIQATAPVNFPAGNPGMVKKALETGGHSLVRGLRNFLRDVATNGGFPRQTVPGTFEVGRDTAVTPGKVVYRNRLMELIQYESQTEQVHEIPLVMSPPWINKFYIMDLAPGKSLVEWAVQHGHTVFVISYRDPQTEHRDVTMSDYLREGPLAAIDVAREITGSDVVNLAGLCLGGAIAASCTAWYAARGEKPVNSLTLMNTLLDYTEPGMLGVFTDEATVQRLERTMRREGFLPASSMKRTFDLLRATDLVWNYVSSSWLQGEDPPPFDMLSWNADSTNMPAAMHVEYLGSHYLRNELAEGKLELAGERLDLGRVRQDTYVITAEKDHIAPWVAVYKGARRLGGTVRFVLSNSGHIAGVVNPPSPKSRTWYSEAAELPESPQDWRDDASERRASWWEDWTPWIAGHAGGMRTPPPMGSAQHPPLYDAPGQYVKR